MKKDIVYSIRMNSTTRQALKRAAARNRRTVASLLDALILNYLEENRYLLPHETGADRRQSKRSRLTFPATTSIKINDVTENIYCVINDISRKGVLLTYMIGPAIQNAAVRGIKHFSLSFSPPNNGQDIEFECETRRIIEEKNEIRLGAAFKDPPAEELDKLNQYLKRDPL